MNKLDFCVWIVAQSMVFEGCNSALQGLGLWLGTGHLFCGIRASLRGDFRSGWMVLIRSGYMTKTAGLEVDHGMDAPRGWRTLSLSSESCSQSAHFVINLIQ